MKLIAIKGTQTKPNSIDIYTDNDNKFASVNMFGTLIIFGENEPLFKDEIKKINVIVENFDLFFTQLIRLQNEIVELLTPTLARQ